MLGTDLSYVNRGEFVTFVTSAGKDIKDSKDLKDTKDEIPGLQYVLGCP